MTAEPDAGTRLAAQSRRIGLLLAHLAGRAVRARVELDDLLQEVFLRALEADLPAWRAELPDDPELHALLRRIARNVVVDVARALRSQKRDGAEVPLARSHWSRAGASRSGTSRIGDTAPGPATRAGDREEEERLRRAFDGLAPDHRRVIGLRQLEGLSACEAGRRLGRSEIAVHSLYRRALEAWERAARRP